MAEEIFSHFSNIDFEVVVYDETEFFYKSNHALFDYPFMNRRNIITRFTIDYSIDDLAVWLDTSDYEYTLTEVDFAISNVCLEAGIFEQLNFVQDFIDLVRSLLPDFSDQKNSTEKAEESSVCEGSGQYFQKLKYESIQT